MGRGKQQAAAAAREVGSTCDTSFLNQEDEGEEGLIPDPDTIRLGTKEQSFTSQPVTCKLGHIHAFLCPPLNRRRMRRVSFQIRTPSAWARRNRLVLTSFFTPTLYQEDADEEGCIPDKETIRLANVKRERLSHCTFPIQLLAITCAINVCLRTL